MYPEEAPAPRGLANCLLRPYQKQSLAFMLNLEKASAADSRAPRGGWLCDEGTPRARRAAARADACAR